VIAGAGAEITGVDFHFDIMCPWAYQASLWIRDVREQLGLTVGWRFFSLEEINHVDGKKHPWESEWSYGWSMMRVGALLRRQDPDLLDRWYLAAGSALHVEGRKPHRREVAAEVLTGWLEFPNLYEVQRPKREQDLHAIAETFRPYLEARDWNTIQKETP
jgi:hypothetical protein